MKKSRSNKADTASRQATYQDVLDAPPHKVAEIVGGKLYINPRPASPQAVAKTRLASLIGMPFDLGCGGPGGWWILFEPELHLGEDIVVPDITGWQRERIPVFPTGDYCTLAPDWVCEVLSPLTRKLDLVDKRAVYARAAVGFLWLADPDARSLEAFKLRGMQWELIGTWFDDAQVSLPPFEAISFNLGKLWLPQGAHKESPYPDLTET